MARTFKKGIDYFPFNVDFFDDDKIQLIEAEFGEKSLVIAVRLLCKIYKNGYYYQWGDDECLLFSRNAGAGIVPNLVNEVVKGLVKRSFFDKRVFDSFNILTSKGIQNRYFDAVARYKKVEAIEEYLLVNVSEMKNVHIIKINADINSENADINQHNKNKNESENKKDNSNELSKNKKSLENRKTEFYNQCAEYVQEYGKETVRAFFDYWTEPNKSKTKMLFETKKTWDLNLRLGRWANNSGFNNTKNQQISEGKTYKKL